MTIVVPYTAVTSAGLYETIRDEIYALTARPDLVSETAIAIRKATMKFHLAELWKHDLVEVTLALTALNTGDTSYRYNIDVTDAVTFPLYKKASHIKEYIATGSTGQELQFTELDADRLLDSYSLEDINYWYQAGMTIHLRANKSLSNVKVGYYKYPNVALGAYDSWIARQFPDAIIEEATAQLFKVIGKDNEYQRLAVSFAENLHLLQVTQI